MHLTVDLRWANGLVAYPLLFVIRPEEDTPKNQEKLQPFTMFSNKDHVTPVHNAWKNGHKKVTLNGVMCNIEVAPDHISEEDIGACIKSAHEEALSEAAFFKSRADDWNERANAIDKAWKEWDVDELERLSALPGRYAAVLRILKEGK